MTLNSFPLWFLMFLSFVLLQAHVCGRELVKQAEGFMDGTTSVAESYFNASSAASEQFARLERKNAELKKREAKLESDNAELSQHLKGKEAMKTSPRSWVDVVNLRKAQAESALEAKAHELTQIAERIPSLEAAMAQREVQVHNIRAKVQTVLN